MRAQLFRIGALSAALVLLGAGCVRVGPGRGPTLTVWGVLDDTETMEPLLKAFEESQGRRQRTKVEYRKVSSPDQYEELLRTALAERRGPDVFLLHVSWFPRWLRTILPAPPDVVSLRSVREEFVDTVAHDLVVEGRVVALPLFVDSLALYYNKDIFNAHGIAQPPRTWAEVAQAAKTVTKFNPVEASQIDQHGIALGAGRNVNRAADIVSALFLQNGVRMIADNEVAFGEEARALEALRFLTGFANPRADTYTWQLLSDYSLDTFAEGETAMMINYSYHRPTIRLKNQRLNVGIAPLPQTNPQQPLTYAGYWAFAVSGATANPDAAWAFVRFITSTSTAQQYLEKSGYPPARRDLVATLRDDPDIGVFAEQALTARTWKQPDNRVVDRAFSDMLDDVVAGRDTIEGALSRAASQVQVSLEQLGPELLVGPTPPVSPGQR